MKFRLLASEAFYNDKEMEKMKKLGFTFEPYQRTTRGSSNYLDSAQQRTIEINTLEELLAFQKEWGDIIVSQHNNDFHGDLKEGEPELRLEIYNGYRE